MKQQIMDWAVENLDTYKKSQTDDTEGKWKFAKVDEALENNIRKARDDKNWDAFVKNSTQLG